MASRLRIFNVCQILNLTTKTGRPKYPVYLQQSFRSEINAAAPPKSKSNRKLLIGAALGAVGVGFGLYSYLSPSESKQKHQSGVALTEKTDFTKNENIVYIKPSREVMKRKLFNFFIILEVMYL